MDVFNPDVDLVDLGLERIEVTLPLGTAGYECDHIAVSELDFYFTAVLCLGDPHVLDEGDWEGD